MSQTRRILHGTWGSLHSLEANCILLRRLHHLQKRRRTLWQLPHEAQWSQQKRFRFRDWHRLCRRIMPINRKEQISYAMIGFLFSFFAWNYLKLKNQFFWKRFFLFSSCLFLDQYFCILLIVVTLQFFSNLPSNLLRIIDIIQSNLNSLDLKSPFSLCVLVVNYDCTYCVCEQIQKSLLHKKFLEGWLILFKIKQWFWTLNSVHQVNPGDFW